MALKNFVNSFHCMSRVHCQSCRDPSPIGDKWRESVGAPAVCPFGMPVGFAPETMCTRCGGKHHVSTCPIPPDFDPEVEKQQGGCCDPPTPL